MLRLNEQVLTIRNCKVQGQGPVLAKRQNTAADFSALIRGLVANDPTAVAELNLIFRHGVLFFLSRSLPSNLDFGSLADECMTRVQEEIRLGALASQSELPKLVRLMINSIVDKRKTQFAEPIGPEFAALALDEISGVGQEALRAFFVLGESRESICSRLGMSEFAFQNIKFQAKQHYIAGQVISDRQRKTA